MIRYACLYIYPTFHFTQNVPHWQEQCLRCRTKAACAMTFTAKLDAIEFFRDGGRHIRVYYQFDDDTTIRESCYHQDYGWFVRGDGVVISNAKNKSPITATRWTEDGGTTKVVFPPTSL